MNFDRYLESLPYLGFFFEKTYAFWRANIAVANLMHVAFGIGLALLIFTQRKKLGTILVALAIAMHVIAFLY